MRCIQKDEEWAAALCWKARTASYVDSRCRPQQDKNKRALREEPSKRDGKVNREGTLENEGRQATGDVIYSENP